MILENPELFPKNLENPKLLSEVGLKIRECLQNRNTFSGVPHDVNKNVQAPVQRKKRGGKL